LAHPYSYDGAAYLEHMMLSNPGGQPVDLALKEMSRDCFNAKMKESLSECTFCMFFIEIQPREIGCTIQKAKGSIYDFERAEMILGITSPNRKRMPRDGIVFKQSSAGIVRSEGSNEDPVNVVTIPAITLSNVDYAQNLRINNFVYLRFVAVGNSFFFPWIENTII
jgi:hypothetical protein